MKRVKDLTPTPTVLALWKMNFEGNIIPHTWYKNIRFENGKADLNAIVILAEVVFWYRPTVIINQHTGAVEGLQKRFDEDLLQRSYDSLADKFGLTKRQCIDAVCRLEEKGLIKRVFRSIDTDKGKLFNVLYLDLDPATLELYTYHFLTFDLPRSNVPPPTGECDTNTENTTEITTKIIPPARASAEKTEPEQPAPTPVPVPVPVVVPVDQPTLYDGLPDSAPEKQEHLRLLGMTTKEREDKRSGHRPRHPNPMVNDQGLTQKLRTEMVNILARIHGHTALLEADEEYVLLYQDMAERLYRIRDMREDTIAKLEAFSDLYDARKRDRWGPPVKNQFLEFVSAIYEERLTGQTNGGGKTNARTNGKAGTKHESTATGLVDAYIAEHGPIDINTPYPPGYRQWPDAERERFFELKYPPQLLPEVSGGVEGE